MEEQCQEGRGHREDGVFLRENGTACNSGKLENRFKWISRLDGRLCCLTLQDVGDGQGVGADSVRHSVGCCEMLCDFPFWRS